jgi:EF-hand domain pair
LAATLEAYGEIDEQRLAEAFDRIDADDTGYITFQNLRDILGDDIPAEYLNHIIDEADILHDHRISYEEFLAMWSEEDDEKFALALEDVGKRRKARTQVNVPHHTSSVVSDEGEVDPNYSLNEGSEFFQETMRRKSVISLETDTIAAVTA